MESSKAGTSNANVTVVRICKISEGPRRTDNRAEARRDVYNAVIAAKETALGAMSGAKQSGTGAAAVFNSIIINGLKMSDIQTQARWGNKGTAFDKT